MRKIINGGVIIVFLFLKCFSQEITPAGTILKMLEPSVSYQGEKMVAKPAVITTGDEIVVGKIYGIKVTTPPPLALESGEKGYFLHQIENLGNGDTVVEIELKEATPGFNTQFYRKNNGKFEVILPNKFKVTLKQQEVYNFYLGITWPESLNPELECEVKLCVTALDEQGLPVVDEHDTEPHDGYYEAYGRTYGGVYRQEFSDRATSLNLVVRGKLIEKGSRRRPIKGAWRVIVRAERDGYRVEKADIQKEDNQSAEYEIKGLPLNGFVYFLRAEAKGYRPYEERIDLQNEKIKEENSQKILEKDIELEPVIEVGRVCTGPNPARGDELTFYYYLPSPGVFEVKVYNCAYELIAVLRERKHGGRREGTTWKIKDVAPGVYFYLAKIKYNGREVKFPLNKLTIVK
jgi:hypothetical protein